MLAEILIFAVSFKAVAIIAAVALLSGGYLGFSYGSAVEKKAQAVAAAAGQKVSLAAEAVAKKAQ